MCMLLCDCVVNNECSPCLPLLFLLVGYDEALGMTLTNETSVSQFIDAADPIRLLTDATAIHFRPEDDVYREHPATSDDVTTSLKDLKVRLSFNLILRCETHWGDTRGRTRSSWMRSEE